MQRLELRNNLAELIKSLKTMILLDIMSAGQSIVDKQTLIHLLIESKAGYDKLSVNPSNNSIIQQFDGDKIYSSDNYAILIPYVSSIGTNPGTNNMQRNILMANNTVSDFYSFHKTLLSTFNIINNLLINENELFDPLGDFNIEEAQNNGILILEIVDDKNIGLKKFVEVLDAVERLVEAVYSLYAAIENEIFEVQPSVLMLDSGSDINFILKLPKKAAGLIAQILHDAWDFISSNKNYRLERNLKSFE